MNDASRRLRVKVGFAGAPLGRLAPGASEAWPEGAEVRELAFELGEGRLVVRLSGEAPEGPDASRLARALGRELGLQVELAGTRPVTYTH
ncbi:MAG: hypothetical protein IRZ11_05605, partial [Clostridia bacterium]|nr:hypothetical protein [Clostridia bacterium]